LRLTTRLPHRPGVYWFTDGAGHVLYVGKATDIQSRVRSYFTGDRRPKVGRLLRQLYAIHHRVCPGPFTASVMEGRMIRAWSPPYNRQGRARRPRSVALAGLIEGGSAARRRRRPRRGRIESRVDVAADPTALLSPLMHEVATHAAAQRYEEAAAVRDDAMRLRNAIVKHRRIEALRGSGRLVVEICGEGTVELHDGVYVESGALVPDSMMPDSSWLVANSRGPADEDRDRGVAAQWLHVNAALVHVVYSERPFCWPAVRIPELTDPVLTRCEAI
jgi:excinuclease UvrABC nuclease subunit